MLCILKSIVAWAILAYVGTNLIGFVVRGLTWSPPPIIAPTERVHEALSREARRLGVPNAAMTVIAFAAIVGYLVAIHHFWGVGLSVAASILMAARVPDLVWELRTGERITRQSAPKGPLYIAASIVMWGTLPMIWYSLCK